MKNSLQIYQRLNQCYSTGLIALRVGRDKEWLCLRRAIQLLNRNVKRGAS